MAHDEDQQEARDRRTSSYIQQALEQAFSAWREWLDEDTPYEFERFPVKPYCWSVDFFFRSEELKTRAQAQEIDKQIRDAFRERINAVNNTLPEEEQFGITDIGSSMKRVNRWVNWKDGISNRPSIRPSRMRTMDHGALSP